MSHNRATARKLARLETRPLPPELAQAFAEVAADERRRRLAHPGSLGRVVSPAPDGKAAPEPS